MKCKLCGNEMNIWKSALGEDGELLLYGKCDCGYEDMEIVKERPSRKVKPDEDKWQSTI